ncbi:hypothetical protein BY996DRAFT_6417684 [Phakopsora pachyrhizi]|nr:hypothetical protein BY996DRAFT_6417684 [Phakopsora pachyrhizi]
MDDTAADMSSNTPPPVLQSESPKTLCPPSFESFMMNAPEPSSMNPEDQLLNDEIQEITPKEYKQNLIEAQIGATQLAMAFSQMSLPRSLKTLAKKLLETCKEKKKSTGAIPVEELIQINENIRNTINNAKSVLSIMENTTQDINAINSNSEAFAIPQYSTYDPGFQYNKPKRIISPSVISKNSSPNFNGGTSPNVDLVSAQALTAEIIRVPEDSQTASAPNEETNKHLYKSFSFFQTGRASQAKYLEAWKSITKFVTRHATNLPPTTNTLENFAFNPGTCSYQTWLKNIVDLGKEVLKPSSTEPCQTSIQSWARIVAASIETVAGELHQPAAPEAHQPISNLNAHLETIKWLESFKKGKSTTAIEGFGALENIRGLFCSSRIIDGSQFPTQWILSVPLKKFMNIVITPFPPKEIPQFKPPSQHALAIAIATDFLIHWQFLAYFNYIEI